MGRHTLRKRKQLDIDLKICRRVDMAVSLHNAVLEKRLLATEGRYPRKDEKLYFHTAVEEGLKMWLESEQSTIHAVGRHETGRKKDR